MNFVNFKLLGSLKKLRKWLDPALEWGPEIFRLGTASWINFHQRLNTEDQANDLCQHNECLWGCFEPHDFSNVAGFQTFGSNL